MLASAHVGVERGRVHGCDESLRRARAVHPAEEAGVRVADAVGHDLSLHRGAHLRQRRWLERQLFATCAYGRGLPCWTLPDGRHRIDRLVERSMGQRSERVPVGGVQGLFAVAHRRRGLYQPPAVPSAP